MKLNILTFSELQNAPPQTGRVEDEEKPVENKELLSKLVVIKFNNYYILMNTNTYKPLQHIS